MKLIIDSKNAASKDLHLNIAGFSINVADLSDSGVISIAIDDSGKVNIDILADEVNVVSEVVEENSNNDIHEVQTPVVQDVLFERLSALRKKIAQELGLPPYFIFHDSSLKTMASSLPVDRDSLKLISGVGKKKLDNYGDRFISLIKEYLAESS